MNPISQLPSAEDNSSNRIADELHELNITLKLILAQQLASPGIPFYEMAARLYLEGQYADLKNGIDNPPGRSAQAA